MSKSVFFDGFGHRVPRVDCEVLMAERGTVEAAYSHRLHEHDFWQVDLACAGQFTARAGDYRFRLHAGECIIIPPGCRHAFDYPVGAAFLAFKFRVRGLFGNLEPLRSDDSEPVNQMLTLLNLVIPAQSRDVGRPGVLVRSLLAGLLAYHYAPAPVVAGTTDDLFARIQEFVRSREGRPVTVAEVAAAVGRSVSCVSSRFRQIRGMSLKRWLDAERAAVARRLLLLSDMSAGQIAVHLGFPDGFSFSRFCRRTLGQSPRQIRRSQPPTNPKDKRTAS